MRALLLILTLMGLAAPASLAWAEDPDDHYLAQCRLQLSERYGAEPDIKIVSKRRSGKRLRLKVAVRLAPGDDGLEKSEFTNCLVDRSKKSDDS